MRFKKRITTVVISLCAAAVIIPLYLRPGSGNPLELNKEFYLNLLVVPPIMRDDFFRSRLNSIVICRGTVKNIDTAHRYKKKYRIIVDDIDAKKLELNITYYVFIDSRKSISLLEEQAVFEFTGQLAAYTPTSVSGDSYILDIIFEKGAVVLE